MFKVKIRFKCFLLYLLSFCVLQAEQVNEDKELVCIILYNSREITVLFYDRESEIRWASLESSKRFDSKINGKLVEGLLNLIETIEVTKIPKYKAMVLNQLITDLIKPKVLNLNEIRSERSKATHILIVTDKETLSFDDADFARKVRKMLESRD